MHHRADHFTIKLPRVQWEDGLDIYQVTPRSAATYRQAVEKLAYYFRREFHYDDVQYNATSPRCDAYLFRDRDRFPQPVVGACCFYPKGKGWALSWIWFHPYSRNRGYLSTYWEYFQKRYGNFWCERPHSAAMKNFLKKMGHYEVYESDTGHQAAGIKH